MRPPNQDGALSEWEEEDEIPLSKLQESSRDEERLEVKPESLLKKRLSGAGISQTQEWLRYEEKLEVERVLPLT